jgi:hypothetical protein
LAINFRSGSGSGEGSGSVAEFIDPVACS